MTIHEDQPAPDAVRILSRAGLASDESANQFVGRQHELGEIRGAISAALVGRGRVLCLTGEPGIGKTRLADEAAAYAASRGMRVHWGRCFEDGGAPAYWVWIQVLRRIIADAASHYSRTLPVDIVRMLPEFAVEAPRPEAGDAEQLRFRLFDAVARLLRESASAKPIMLVLDDLHDADVASLQLLKFVARVVHDAKLVIVGTYRDAEMRHSPERAAIVLDILRDATLLPLAGLAEDEVGRMVEVRLQGAPDPSFVAILRRTTAGNPLFVDGIIRVLAAEGRFGSAQPIALASYKLPDQVRAAIQRWLVLLSPQARTLLASAALIGLEFELGLLGKATATAPERVAELISSAQEVGIVTSVGKSLCRFAHPLLREVLSQEPVGGERVQLHRAIAKALEEIHGADTQYLAELAHHYRLAGDDEGAIDYSIRAAAAARSTYAYEQEISHLRAAKELAEKSNQNLARRASILERLGTAIDNINQTSSEAKGILESAAKFYEATGEVSSAARVLIRLGSTTRFDVNLPSALVYLKKSESLVGREDHKTLALLYIAMSDTCYFLGKYEDGLRWSQLAMELSEKIGSTARWVLAASSFAHMLFYSGRLGEGLALLRTAFSKAIELGSHPGLTSGISMAIDTLMGEIWDPLKGIDALLSERARSGVTNRWSTLIQIDDRLVKRYLMAGKITEAREIFLKASEFIEVHGRDFTFESVLVDSSRASLCRAEGDWQGASDRLAQSVRTFRAQENCHSAAHCLCAQGRVERFQGDLARARALEQEALDLAPHDPHLEMQIRPQLASLCAEMNQPDEAESVLARCREILSAGENWRGLAGNVSRAEAMLAAARGNMDSAATEFNRAIEIFVRYQLPFEHAEALLHWGRALDKTGEGAIASEKLDQAIELYRRIGAGQPWIDRVEGERAKVGPNRSNVLRIGQASVEAQFRKEGDYWRVSYSGETFRLQDSKALKVIAYLLQHPGHQFHARELAALDSRLPSASGALDRHDADQISTDLGDAGPGLDARARTEYQARLGELRAGIDEAERDNDLGRVAKLRAEADALSAVIIREAGFRGHERKQSSHSERARVAITRSIHRGIEKIRELNPVLGRHLANSIHTGYFCSYAPDQANQVTWRF